VDVPKVESGITPLSVHSSHSATPRVQVSACFPEIQNRTARVSANGHTLADNASPKSSHSSYDQIFSYSGDCLALAYWRLSSSSDLRGANVHIVCSHAGEMWENEMSRKLAFAIRNYKIYSGSHYSTVPVSVVSYSV